MTRTLIIVLHVLAVLLAVVAVALHYVRHEAIHYPAATLGVVLAVTGTYFGRRAPASAGQRSR